MNGLGRVYTTVRDRARRRLRAPTPFERTRAEFEALALADAHPSAEQLFDELRRHATEKVPFYRDFARAHGGRDIPLEAFPILTRDMLRSEKARLIADDAGRRNTWEHASGGSTGAPVAVVHDDEFAAKAQGLQAFADRRILGGPFYNQLILWGANTEKVAPEPPGWKARLLRGMGLLTTHFNTFDFDDDRMLECVTAYNLQKADYIFGYTGSVYKLAEFIRRRGLDLHGAPRAIQVTAETLHPFMRQTIEEVFGCRVCSHYGSREVGPIVWEGADGRMYVMDMFAIVEVVDDEGRPTPQGREGRVLVTTLHNFAMPLIRYDIGDIGVPSSLSRLYGRTLPTLERVVGKTTEAFTRIDGTTVHGQFFTNQFYFRDWVSSFQVVQHEVDDIEICWVPWQAADIPPSDQREIEDAIVKKMRGPCRVRWQRMETIPRTPAGKHLYVRSKVGPPSIGSAPR